MHVVRQAPEFVLENLWKYYCLRLMYKMIASLLCIFYGFALFHTHERVRLYDVCE